MAAVGLQAQTLEGTVRDAHTEQPLEQANLRTAPENLGTTTGKEGKYRLKFPEPGTYTLLFSYLGYEPLRREVTLAEGEVLQLSVKLEPSRDELQEATVRATQSRKTAPIAQTNLEERDIRRVFSGQDAQFVLSQQTPSMISYSEAGTGFSNYGGLRLRGLDQSRLNITFNGVPLNDMLDQGVFFSNFTDIMNSVGSVQVQRGVGFTTNGSASYGGSINFQGPDIWQEDPSAELQLSSTTFATGLEGTAPGSGAPGLGKLNTFRGSAEFKTGTLDDKWALYGRMSNFTSDGYRYHSGTDSWSMFLTGGYRSEKDLLTFTFFNGRSQSQLSYLPVPLPQIQQDPRSNSNFRQDRDDFGQQFAQLRYTREINPHNHWTTSLYYGGAGGDFPFGLGDSTGNFSGQINYPLTNRHFGLFSNWLYEENSLKIRGGVHAYTFHRNNWETMLPNNADTLYNDSTRKNEVSAFVNASYRLGRWTFHADVQLRQTQIDFFPDRQFVPREAEVPQYNYTFLNPKIGLSYDVSAQLQLYASLGRTGREPTKFDLWGGAARLDSANLLPLQDPSTAVQPEYVNDLELGLRYQQERFQLEANLFYMDFEQKIEPIGERINFVQLRKNVEQSFRTGLELTAEWQSTSGYFLRGMATGMISEIAEYAPDNNPQDRVYRNVNPALTPVFQGRLTLGYEWGDRWSAALTGQYIGEMYISPTNNEDLTIPSSFVLNSRLEWRFWKDNTVALRMRNLLDELYYTYGEQGSFQGQSVPAYFVQPPRNINLMVTLRF